MYGKKVDQFDENRLVAKVVARAKEIAHTEITTLLHGCYNLVTL